MAWLDGVDDLELGAEARLREHKIASFRLLDDGPELIEALDE